MQTATSGVGHCSNSPWTVVLQSVPICLWPIYPQVGRLGLVTRAFFPSFLNACMNSSGNSSSVSGNWIEMKHFILNKNHNHERKYSWQVEASS